MKSLLSLILLLTAVFVLPDISSAQSAPGSSAANPSYKEDPDKTFTKVEIEPAFPGGNSAWLDFLKTNLDYPRKAKRNKTEGTVVVQFIVDVEGNLSNLRALSGDPLLLDAALKAMAKSPKWVPAIQNGRIVRAYKNQPIVFKL